MGGSAKKTAYRPPGLFRYHSPNIPITAIRRYARRIAEKFDPDKIILFGSYAYGQPDEWRDVDLLVVIPTRNQIDQSLRIVLSVAAPFSVDLIVRTPKRMLRDWEDGDWFLREVLAKGKVLYEKTDGAVGSQGRGRHTRRNKPGAERALAQ
jgi:predicted nucleotidyltransferase